MDKYTVAKPFTTLTRRFAPGQEVTEADIDGALTIADLVKLGCVSAPAKPTKAAKEAPSAE
ncbi:hypothetical protein D9623_33615 (plasmid) [Azospirillum brasilense]|uniref:Uncharacterized protein n=1 Tax=Azospirillum brasilense TaxID=192 RepID=A0A4D8QUJ1_AZOBR|nr:MULTISPECIES: hypothetical protein [Azospirillum]MDW7555380.1 hypothetical protein [Azospirillum brasilense]MDW7595212.1 hypothetical protein [Azospirillum brasilense]MDW7630365.1 hypothetical protein [Azospirillum brasilense]MDX5949733.1 hypothetical protein [Azospirillum brasilense]OPH16864.1 hypothetical protein FE89_02590 [Azospirillum brasilense]